MQNNIGRIFRGAGGVSVTFGSNSPATDDLPRPALAGDVRYYQGTDNAGKAALKWVCITAGTPGVWQLVESPPNWPVLTFPFVYLGAYSHPGVEVFMAPATADWMESNEGIASPNVIAIPPTALLTTTGVTGPAPTLAMLSLYLSKNQWDTPVPNGLLFRIRLADGTILGSGTVNADGATVGAFTPIAQPLAAGVLDTQMGVTASLEADAGAGDAILAITGSLVIYRDCTVDFPS